jgi:hypothetical protein
MLGKNGLDTGMVQAVIHRLDMRTRHTKDKLDAEPFHVFNDQLADWNLHGVTQLLISRHCNALRRVSHNLTARYHQPRGPYNLLKLWFFITQAGQTAQQNPKIHG